MNTKYLNYASDLRRIASWMATDQKEMFPLASRMWREASGDEFVRSLLKKYDANKDPIVAANNNRDRMFFAEQVLVTSIMLS